MKAMKIQKTVVFLLLIAVAGMAFAEDYKIEVLSAVGTVEKKVGESWIPLKKGDILVKGNLISTGFRSSATLKFDGSVLSVAALSRLTVSELLEKDDARDSSIFLDAGKISANIKSSDNKRVNFTVRTPVATASVKGTAGMVTALGQVESYQNVWTTSVVNPDGSTSKTEVPVSQGMTTKIDVNAGDMKSPIKVTLEQSTGVSPMLQPLAELEASASGGTSFVADAPANNGASMPSGATVHNDICEVVINVTYKK